MKTSIIVKIFTKLLIFLSFSFVLFSCELEEPEQVVEAGVDISNDLQLTLQAEQVVYEGFPRVSKVFFGSEMEVVDLGEGNYALGDILLTEKHFAQDAGGDTKGVWDRRKTKWPNSTILYRYSSNMPQQTKNKVNIAAAQISNRTNLTVRKWNSNDSEGYVWVGYDESKGCSAQLGYLNKKFPGQRMNIATSCSKGSVIHEFLHVAGIIHEQNHWNRDAYVEILFNNILDDKEFNYTKVSDADGLEISDVVDINSIMMYGSYFWRTQQAIDNGWRSMRKVDGSTIVPNRNYMTTNDIRVVNRIY